VNGERVGVRGNLALLSIEIGRMLQNPLTLSLSTNWGRGDF